MKNLINYTVRLCVNGKMIEVQHMGDLSWDAIGKVMRSQGLSFCDWAEAGGWRFEGVRLTDTSFDWDREIRREGIS